MVRESKLEYFTPIESLPKRCHLENISRKVLDSFLNSDLKLVKVNLEVFNNRTAKAVANSLSRYCRRYNLPIAVHCIGNDVFLEKV